LHAEVKDQCFFPSFDNLEESSKSMEDNTNLHS
jgi:hypothetical protein